MWFFQDYVQYNLLFMDPNSASLRYKFNFSCRLYNLPYSVAVVHRMTNVTLSDLRGFKSGQILIKKIKTIKFDVEYFHHGGFTFQFDDKVTLFYPTNSIIT
jgi:hypothetical protein